MPNTFDSELKSAINFHIGFLIPEHHKKELLVEIKLLISKYAPKEQKDKDNVLLPAIIKEETDGIFAYVLGFKDGVNLYRAELFREMGIDV